MKKTKVKEWKEPSWIRHRLFDLVYYSRKLKLWASLCLVPTRWRKIYFANVHDKTAYFKDLIQEVPYTPQEIKKLNIHERYMATEGGFTDAEIEFSDKKNHWIRWAFMVVTPSIKIWDLADKEEMTFHAAKWWNSDEVLLMKEKIGWQDVAKACLEFCKQRKLTGTIYLDGTRVGRVSKYTEYDSSFNIFLPEEDRKGQIEFYRMVRDKSEEPLYPKWIVQQTNNLSLIEMLARKAQQSFVKKERR